ncbi:ATP-NAD kinase family protein [Marinobacterium sediminicola]|uniref:Predicted polyphosphate- or ATP-dependent NAD kinase n=1 Tax=Marinobacterium sediminicola TaxID=518898 RepID=A0ABY1RZ72_9GAMM|nr:ATP-NAD kinase family protein [Marinobacterium sediminicola]ULG67974.1 ATP-NAD kinase family protein [Marinobacterium sediminicola]SMR73518.1 Predicted polyphosphate- or ATP-dependent NAD kinase [Marinobacterium sediminicola]
MSFRLGLIVNPFAGLGGSVALKGSDGAEVARQALALGAVPRAQERTRAALQPLQGLDVEVLTWAGEMGGDLASDMGFVTHILGQAEDVPSTAEDTCRAAQALLEARVDLVLFAGGDGTARNICETVGERIPVLGVPAGVKIHSGVYALTPQAAGQLVAMLVRGELVSIDEQEVRDLDEEAFREGKVRARFYGEMRVPSEHRYLQHVKNSSNREDETLVLDEIAAGFVEQMEPEVLYLMGSGSTVAAIMEALGLNNTLLGVDAVLNGEVIAADCTAQELLALSQGRDVRIVITLIGGQGHIIGRGNQQLSAELLKHVGRENLYLVATRTKLNALEGRPLIIDSGEPQLDHDWSGLIEVHTGYRDAVLYRIAVP